MPEDSDKAAELARLAAHSGDPWTASNPYFAHAEQHMDAMWAKRIQPFIADCDLTHVVDLACGHGRNSAKLLPLAEGLIGVDIQQSNIDVCSKRFETEPKARFVKNNGYDIADVPSGWATLVYTFDAMVHFEPEVVRNYVLDLRRALRPGGHAFLHHSNYTGGRDWRTNPASRNYMSLEMMRGFAAEAELEVIRQQVIDWGQHKDLDALTLLRKPAALAASRNAKLRQRR